MQRWRSLKFQSTLVGQLTSNPFVSKDQSIQIEVSILYMKPKLLTTANHDTMLNLGSV